LHTIDHAPHSALARSIAFAFALSIAACADPAGTPAASARPSSSAVVSLAAAASTSAQPPAASAVPEEIAAQHVLISYKGAKNAKGATRSKDEAKKLAQRLRDDAAKGADFGQIATNHSEDPASSARLGSLGKFKRSEMVKAFSDAAFSLPVGGLSEVIETEFGFHVIKRNQ
jgi:parvulin-like peptidyl-prolyl isomerase